MTSKQKAQSSSQSNEKSTASKTPKIRPLKVSDLRPHPQQDELVGDMPRPEFEALTADIKKNGIQTPLIVLADEQTVVCGHQRLLAATRLGFETVPCIVRNDLGDVDDPRVVELLLSDNLRRRQLQPLAKARYAKRLAEIEYRRRTSPCLQFEQYERLAVRDAVGKILGLSGRNVGRYLAVLEAPAEVQQAFEQGLIPLVLAARMATAPAKSKDAAAATIGKLLAQRTDKNAKTIGSQIKTCLQKLFTKPKPKQPTPAPSPMRPLRAIKDCLEANLPEASETYGEIINVLRTEEADPDLPSEFNSLLADLTLSIVPELHELARVFSELVARIERDLASDADGPRRQSA